MHIILDGITKDMKEKESMVKESMIAAVIFQLVGLRRSLS